MYSNLENLKSLLGVQQNETVDDALLQRLLDISVLMLEQELGFGFEAATATTKWFDLSAIRQGRLYFGFPLAELVSVTNGDGTDIPVGSIRLQPANETPSWSLSIARNSGYYWRLNADGEFEQVIGVEGYWAWSKTVPANISYEVDRLAMFLLRQKDHSLELDRVIRTYDGNALMPSRLPSDVLDRLQAYVGLTS